MTDRPFLLVGDGWQNPTGLGRIARQLAGVLQVDCHIGFHPPATVVRGSQQQASFGHLGEDWNAAIVCDWIGLHFNVQEPGVLLIVWDPARAWHFLKPARRHLPGWELWGYFAIDGENPQGTVGGPAGEAVQQFDRVLAYSEYGAQVLRPLRQDGVAWLPHGLTLLPSAAIGTRASCDSDVRARLIPAFDRARGDWLLGGIASNQPRKDLGLFCAVLQQLRERGEPVWGWLHTDLLVKTWSLPELADAYGVTDCLRVTIGELPDIQLLRYLRSCDVTLGVGRGEGFGYTHIESLSVGTPVLHVDYAGGAEFVPPQWRMPWVAMDRSNVYAIGRPVQDAEPYVQAIGQIRAQDRTVIEAYCRGAVAHLNWHYLLPRWQTWQRQGLEAPRGERRPQ